MSGIDTPDATAAAATAANAAQARRLAAQAGAAGGGPGAPSGARPVRALAVTAPEPPRRGGATAGSAGEVHPPRLRTRSTPAARRSAPPPGTVPDPVTARILARSTRATLHGLPHDPPSPHWRITERTLRLLTVAAAATAAALATGHAWLLALAAAPAVLLALAAPGAGRPTKLTTAVGTEPRRCFEGERITVRVDLRHDGTTGGLDPVIALGRGLELESVAVGPAVLALTVRADRWGRWALGTIDIDVSDAGGLTCRTVRADLGEVDVFPVPTAARLTPVPVRLPERIGEHTTAHEGSGIEVVGVRPYVPGERQRRIHWPSTTRRGSVQINQFAAERAADAVVLLDALGDFHDAATSSSSLDESLRAATGLTRAYLRRHDRVGLVAVGGQLRWLTADTGVRHLHRMVESVLEVRRDRALRDSVPPRLPLPALPRHALVYAFTPLADQRILEVLGWIGERGNPLVVVEVPAGEPTVEPGDEIGAVALPLWRAERDAMRRALRNRGVPVVQHTPGEALDLALAPLLRRRIGGRSR
ncbi:DUF58 domain-containing protein [Kitasatospora misakiensis]|uniref:DUF58 domain-containing protein n=1 Tax=Kitasatospora misakiensis TaxID=67330 RepID=A0ABW0X8K1_9ACTN